MSALVTKYAHLPCALFAIVLASATALPAISYGNELLLAEYESAVERLRAAYAEMTMTVRVTHYRAEGQEPTRAFLEEYSRAGESIRIVRDVNVTDRAALAVGDREVRVADPEVSFMIRRDKGHPAYTTERIVGYNSSESSMRLKAKPLYAPFSFLDFMIPDFMDEPTFKVREVREETDPETGARLIKLFWECPYDDIMQTGWFGFLPDQSWALRELWVQNQNKEKPDGGRALIRFRVDYDGAVEDVPLVSHVRLWQEFHDVDDLPANVPQGIPINIEDYEVLKIAPEAPPHEAFTLEAFGIPNPGAPGSRWVRTTFFLVNAALVLVLAALLLWRFSRKRARAQA